MPTGYCMKCKATREMENFETYVLEKRKRNKRTGEVYTAERVMGGGLCGVCGAKMSRAYGKPGGSRVTFVSKCPYCHQERQIADDDYMCITCRKEIAN